MTNLSLPGNPRYQPNDLKGVFGYDNLARALVEVELATLRTLGDVGIVPTSDIELLTPDIEEKLLATTMTLIDRVEREDVLAYGSKKTRHDIRALVRILQTHIPEPLQRWVHVPLTSYDVIDTGRALQFIRAHNEVVLPKVNEVVRCLAEQATKYACEVQIGRTHGQHALPITFGFWFATILSRVLYNIDEMNRYASGLVGKISGAVGAYNAQVGLDVSRDTEIVFEDRVLERLGLKPAPISTQILPPEPLAYYLYSALMLSASIGQFGRDARHLMRNEIAELAEPFEEGQVGSSTMAHKRNPMTFENLEGTWLKSKSEFGKVLDTMISEHQRDLVGSSLARDFPILIVNLTLQLDTLLRKSEKSVPFLSRLVVDTEACKRNLGMQGDKVLAEPMYLALQMYGYRGDAHALVNHRAMPLVGEHGSLFEAVCALAEEEPEVDMALENIPTEVFEMLRDPSRYTGRAAEKVQQVCKRAEEYLART